MYLRLVGIHACSCVCVSNGVMFFHHHAPGSRSGAGDLWRVPFLPSPDGRNDLTRCQSGFILTLELLPLIPLTAATSVTVTGNTNIHLFLTFHRNTTSPLIFHLTSNQTAVCFNFPSYLSLSSHNDCIYKPEVLLFRNFSY